MSNIPNNTSIVLGASSPKKDAVVAQPGLPAAAGELRIWAAADCPERKTQQLVGSFTELFDFAKSNMPLIEASVATPVVIHMPWNGNRSDITIDGVPTSDEVRLEIGQDIATGQKSHFLNRTFKRLIERWLEEAK